MDYRTLEINVAFLEGFESSKNLFFRTQIYAVVSLITASSASRQIKTPLGMIRGKEHMWDFPMRFYAEELKLQQNSIVLVIQLRKKRPFCTGKDLGQVYVPLKELFDDPQHKILNSPYMGCYPVVTPLGKPKGSLRFCYKFSDTYRIMLRNFSNEDVSMLMQLGSTAQEHESDDPWLTDPVFKPCSLISE